MASSWDKTCLCRVSTSSGSPPTSESSTESASSLRNNTNETSSHSQGGWNPEHSGAWTPRMGRETSGTRRNPDGRWGRQEGSGFQVRPLTALCHHCCASAGVGKVREGGGDGVMKGAGKSSPGRWICGGRIQGEEDGRVVVALQSCACRPAISAVTVSVQYLRLRGM